MKHIILPLFIIPMFFQPMANADTSTGLPDTIDPNRHYLIYLHGQIVEGSDGSPNSAAHGPYEYHDIVKALEQEGFWVISEIRRKNTNVGVYAGLISFYIDQLKKEGVSSSKITVVGGSKGGMIACYVSNKQQDPDLYYVIMAGFFDRLKQDPKMIVSGRVLAIHDKADTNGINPKYFISKSKKTLTKSKIVTTDNGWGHGLIFKPRKAWIKEVVKWSGINESKGK